MTLLEQLNFKTELSNLIIKFDLDDDAPHFVITEYLFRALESYKEVISNTTKHSVYEKSILRDSQFRIDVSGMSEAEIKELKDSFNKQ